MRQKRCNGIRFTLSDLYLLWEALDKVIASSRLLPTGKRKMANLIGRVAREIAKLENNG